MLNSATLSIASNHNQPLAKHNLEIKFHHVLALLSNSIVIKNINGVFFLMLWSILFFIKTAIYAYGNSLQEIMVPPPNTVHARRMESKHLITEKDYTNPKRLYKWTENAFCVALVLKCLGWKGWRIVITLLATSKLVTQM